MSERPFMQLYVSDFIGDTLHLSTEQVGAYLLLLMAMWNAGGSLPDDEAKLARVARMSVRKWRAVAADMMGFFDREGGAVRHNRLTKELQKSESKSHFRSNAGKAGGNAKALKYKERRLANATDLPWHSPDTRNQKEEKTLAQQPTAARRDEVLDKLLKAAGVKGNPPTGLAFPGPILGLIDAGYDLEADILPAIRAKPNPRARSWGYFVPQIREAAETREQIASERRPDPLGALASWPLEKWRSVLENSRQRHEWQRQTYGPPPFAPGCLVPLELLTDQDREIAA